MIDVRHFPSLITQISRWYIFFPNLTALLLTETRNLSQSLSFCNYFFDSYYSRSISLNQQIVLIWKQVPLTLSLVEIMTLHSAHGALLTMTFVGIENSSFSAVFLTCTSPPCPRGYRVTFSRGQGRFLSRHKLPAIQLSKRWRANTDRFGAKGWQSTEEFQIVFRHFKFRKSLKAGIYRLTCIHWLDSFFTNSPSCTMYT